MKKVIKNLIKICGSLLVLFGFLSLVNSCNKVPYADYFIDGKIVSEDTDLAINGLKVSIKEESNPHDSILLIETKFTNQDGEFAFVFGGNVIMKYVIEVQDIDGEENGAFNDTIINVTVSSNEFAGGGKGYEGKYHKHFDIKLKPKN